MTEVGEVQESAEETSGLIVEHNTDHQQVAEVCEESTTQLHFRISQHLTTEDEPIHVGCLEVDEELSAENETIEPRQVADPTDEVSPVDLCHTSD